MKFCDKLKIHISAILEPEDNNLGPKFIVKEI